MLRRINLKKFKAWNEADLKLGKVTGLFGTNSAGKSGVIQLLLLLKQTRNVTDRHTILDFGGDRNLANLGTFEEVVHKNKGGAKIAWLLEWDLPQKLEIESLTRKSHDQLFEGESLQIKYEVGSGNNQLFPCGLAYRFDNKDFRYEKNRTQDPNGEFKFKTDADLASEPRGRGRPPHLTRPVKGYLFSSEVKASYPFLSDFELEYEKLMDSIYYLGPLRDYPKRQYHWSGSAPEGVGSKGEYAVNAILAATAGGEKRKRSDKKNHLPFQKIIASCLKDLGLIQDFYLEEIKSGTNLFQAKLKTSPAAPPSLLTDVGFGVSQILPTLVLLYWVPDGSIVLMEQPEIHLHPSVQMGLADIMIEVANARNVQIIVESHSEHLLRRLQRRVAENAVHHEDVRLYFVSSKRGAANLNALHLNQWGEIVNWPKNFFGNEMGEISSIAKASLKRKLRQKE